MRILCNAKDSHVLSTKSNSVFVILMFGNFNESLNFEQLGPGSNETSTFCSYVYVCLNGIRFILIINSPIGQEASFVVFKI